MKHLIEKEHHPHLKKRAILELLGLSVLISICINQRELILEAVKTIQNSNIFFLFLLYATYWLILPLTAFSYRLLASRKIPIRTTILALLAGAGPGRIIPGGLGNISISTVYLHKIGLNLHKAIIITVSNNMLGVIANLTLVSIALANHSTLSDNFYRTISVRNATFMVLFIFGLLTIYQWLSHARATKRTIKKLHRDGTQLIRQLISNPQKLMSLLLLAFFITIGHTAMVMLSGSAVGANIPFVEALIALSAGVFIGGSLPTPGGFGAVEAGMAAALIVMGYDSVQATSIALLFRTATYWQPLIPGVFAYFNLKRRNLL